MTDIVLKAHEDLLSFDVSDDALELAASAAKIGASFTLGSCTGRLSVPVDPVSCISRHFWNRPPRGGLSVLTNFRYWHKADISLCAAHVRF